MCCHLLCMHKKWFADSWLFLNNFKPLLHSNHCISAPDWMQSRAGCPGGGALPRQTHLWVSHQLLSTAAASKQLHLLSCSRGQFCLNPKTLPMTHVGKGADCQGRTGQERVSWHSPLSCHRTVAVGMATGPSSASHPARNPSTF